MNQSLVCQNCNRKIADFEQHYLHKGQVLCCDCNALFNRVEAKKNNAHQVENLRIITKILGGVCILLVIVVIVLLSLPGPGQLEIAKQQKLNETLKSDIQKLMSQIKSDTADLERLRAENARLADEAAKVPSLLSAAKKLMAKNQAQNQQYQKLVTALEELKQHATEVASQQANLQSNVKQAPAAEPAPVPAVPAAQDSNAAEPNVASSGKL
jgi:predicted RNase H-like nuclease (RuvC/YqgF family)